MILMHNVLLAWQKISEHRSLKCHRVFVGKIFIRKCHSKYLGMGWLKAACHTYNIDGFLAVSFVK